MGILRALMWFILVGNIEASGQAAEARFIGNQSKLIVPSIKAANVELGISDWHPTEPQGQWYFLKALIKIFKP